MTPQNQEALPQIIRAPLVQAYRVKYQKKSRTSCSASNCCSWFKESSYQIPCFFAPSIKVVELYYSYVPTTLSGESLSGESDEFFEK